MKTKTKALALALCAVLLVVTTVFVTMAYLTSKTDVVTNTFTVGKVTITLDEAKVTTDGVKVEGEERVKENSYHLVPGHFYVKDPTVHVDDESEDCWLFVKVENGLANAEASGATSIESQMANKGWTKVEGTDVYAYATKQAAGANVIVFDSFTIAGTTDVSLYEDAKIIVTAYAIQADGFATAAEAWKVAGAEAQAKAN